MIYLVIICLSTTHTYSERKNPMIDAIVEFVNNAFSLLGTAGANILGLFSGIFNSIAGSL